MAQPDKTHNKEKENANEDSEFIIKLMFGAISQPSKDKAFCIFSPDTLRQPLIKVLVPCEPS